MVLVVGFVFVWWLLCYGDLGLDCLFVGFVVLIYFFDVGLGFVGGYLVLVDWMVWLGNCLYYFENYVICFLIDCG